MDGSTRYVVADLLDGWPDRSQVHYITGREHRKGEALPIVPERTVLLLAAGGSVALE